MKKVNNEKDSILINKEKEIKDIVDSVKILKDTCEKHSNCSTCPLSSDDFMRCYLTENNPSDWNIKPSKIHKVFDIFE